MRSFRILAFSMFWMAAAVSDGGAAERRAAPAMLDFIGLWLESEFGLPRPPSAPEIIAVPARQLVERRYGTDAAAAPDEIVALYDDDAGAILVSTGWTGRSAPELSVLVHEMVHHMQKEAGTVFACPAEREALAYRAQESFLGLFGLDLKTAFGIDRALILVATACTH